MSLKNRIILRGILLCAVLLICTAMFSACGDGMPNVNEDFTPMQKLTWRWENLRNKYTMNGGYYICYKGVYYPVEFDEGDIVRFDNAPTDLFFLSMRDLYTDPQLQNKCAFANAGPVNNLFLGYVHHDGYVLVGDRPEFGTVLYIDETDEREFFPHYGEQSFGPDDELVIQTSNENAVTIWCTAAGAAISGKDGVIFEELNTVRKMYQYAIDNGFPLDARLKYSGIPYPSSFFTSACDSYTNEKVWLQISYVDFCAQYDVSVCHNNANVQDRYFKVLNSADQIAVFESEIHSGSRYADVVLNDDTQVVQYFDTEQGRVIEVFYSLDDFIHGFLEVEGVADPYTAMVATAYSTTDQRNNWSYLDFDQHTNVTFYPVWEACKVVKLHAHEDEMLVGIGNETVATLPDAIRPGYTFEGWYTDESYTGQPVTIVSASNYYEHLYAKFQKVDFYLLTLESYNGQTFDDIRYAYGDEVQLPMLTKAFHLFKGWCIDAECKTEPMKTVSPEFFGSYHLYPCFEPRAYTITLLDNGTATQVTVRYGEEFTLPVENVGEGFLGYFGVDGLQYTDENGRSLAPFTDGADIQLLAKYKEG